MSTLFATEPAWSQTTKSGFRQQVFVMYHSTNRANVWSILNEGFKIPHDLINNNRLFLGNGLYVSRDINKTRQYGDVCFKLLVYPGKTYVVEDDNGAVQQAKFTWHQNFSSAWLPPDNKLGKLEETCIKSADQVRILGIAYGHELLDDVSKTRIANCKGTEESLDVGENKILDKMLEDMGLVYSNFVHRPSNHVLQDIGGGEIALVDWTGRDNQLWSRTWDNCLENKASGRALTWDGHSDLPWLEPVNQLGLKEQKWRLDRYERLVHKQTNNFLCVDGYLDDYGGGLVMKKYNEGRVSGDSWKFRCLDEIRKTDTYIDYTPWHDMTNWD